MFRLPRNSYEFNTDPNKGIDYILSAIRAIQNTNVSQIIAGTNISISPVSGTGAVTINASGGTTPTLDQVTTAGNTTANAVTVGGLVVDTNTLVVDSVNNRVGIGTSSPNRKLQVSDTGTSGVIGTLEFYNDNTTYTNLWVKSNGTGVLLSSHTSGNGYLTAINALRMTSNGYPNQTNVWLGNGSRFRISNTAETETYIIVPTTGNVLIGTTTDNGYKLQVNGDATINGVRVGLGGGSVGTNTIVGFDAGLSNTTGNSNTAVGYQSQTALTTGVQNTSIGRESLKVNTTGGKNTAVGFSSLLNNTASNNTAVGFEAAYSNTSGDSVVAVGHQALRANITGTWNIAIGRGSLSSVTTNSFNVAVGGNSGGNPTGSVAIGYQALGNNSGQWNVAVGYKAAISTTTGNNNTALGIQSFYNNTTGGENIAIGREAVYSSTTANGIVGIGHAALRANTASNNTAVGYEAGYSNTSGTDITAIGYQSLRANTTGASNVGVGTQTLYSNTTGEQNTAIGRQALRLNTTGGYNSAVGFFSLYNNTTGNQNVAHGVNALYANTIGAYNTAIGLSSLRFNIDGTFNTAIGQTAGYSNVSGSNNVFIGRGAGYNETGSNKLYIGNSSTNTLIYGDFSTGNVSIGSTVDAGYKLDVNGSARVQGNLYFSTSGSYFYGDTNNIRLYDKNNSIILQSFPSGVANSETYLKSSSGNKFIRINDSAITLEWFNGNVSDTVQKPINIIRGFFGNVVATDKTVLNITTPFFSNLTNATTLTGILIDINDTTTYTGFTTVRAIETVRGDVVFNGGNVGIGTTAPAGPLHVKYSSATLAGITIENDGVGYNAGSMTLRSGTSGGVNMSATSSGGLYWFNLNTTSNTLSLPATGNLIVGGAVDAGYRLDVKGGNARFEQNVDAATYSVAGNAGYSGIINFPGNPPGSQNLEFLQGILINVF